MAAIPVLSEIEFRRDIKINEQGILRISGGYTTINNTPNSNQISLIGALHGTKYPDASGNTVNHYITLYTKAPKQTGKNKDGEDNEVSIPDAGIFIGVGDDQGGLSYATYRPEVNSEENTPLERGELSLWTQNEGTEPITCLQNKGKTQHKIYLMDGNHETALRFLRVGADDSGLRNKCVIDSDGNIRAASFAMSNNGSTFNDSGIQFKSKIAGLPSDVTTKVLVSTSSSSSIIGDIYTRLANLGFKTGHVTANILDFSFDIEGSAILKNDVYIGDVAQLGKIVIGRIMAWKKIKEIYNVNAEALSELSLEQTISPPQDNIGFIWIGYGHTQKLLCSNSNSSKLTFSIKESYANSGAPTADDYISDYVYFSYFIDDKLDWSTATVSEYCRNN